VNGDNVTLTGDGLAVAIRAAPATTIGMEARRTS